MIINNILRKEIGKRNDIVAGIREESKKILQLILEYESKLQDQEKLSSKLEFLEEQLIKLQLLMDKNTDLAGANKNTLNGKEIKTSDVSTLKKKKQIVMYSDSFGRNMGHLIKNNLPESYTIINRTKPNASVQEILNDDIIHGIKEEEILILTISNFTTIRKYIENYMSVLRKLATQSKAKKIKLVITSIAYERGQKEENDTIFNINTKIYKLCLLYDNLVFLDVNNLQKNNSNSISKNELAKHIGLSCVLNRNNNLITLVDTNNEVSETKISEDFSKIVHHNKNK